MPFTWQKRTIPNTVKAGEWFTIGVDPPILLEGVEFDTNVGRVGTISNNGTADSTRYKGAKISMQAPSDRRVSWIRYIRIHVIHAGLQLSGAPRIHVYSIPTKIGVFHAGAGRPPRRLGLAAG